MQRAVRLPVGIVDERDAEMSGAERAAGVLNLNIERSGAPALVSHHTQSFFAGGRAFRGEPFVDQHPAQIRLRAADHVLGDGVHFKHSAAFIHEKDAGRALLQ